MPTSSRITYAQIEEMCEIANTHYSESTMLYLVMSHVMFEEIKVVCKYDLVIHKEKVKTLMGLGIIISDKLPPDNLIIAQIFPEDIKKWGELI